MTNTVRYQQRFETQHKRNEIIKHAEIRNYSSGLQQGWTIIWASVAKSYVFTYQVKRTVATLPTALDNTVSAFCQRHKQSLLVGESTNWASGLLHSILYDKFRLLFFFTGNLRQPFCGHLWTICTYLPKGLYANLYRLATPPSPHTNTTGTHLPTHTTSHSRKA